MFGLTRASPRARGPSSCRQGPAQRVPKRGGGNAAAAALANARGPAQTNLTRPSASHARPTTGRALMCRAPTRPTHPRPPPPHVCAPPGLPFHSGLGLPAPPRAASQEGRDPSHSHERGTSSSNQRRSSSSTHLSCHRTAARPYDGRAAPPIRRGGCRGRAFGLCKQERRRRSPRRPAQRGPLHQEAAARRRRRRCQLTHPRWGIHTFTASPPTVFVRLLRTICTQQVPPWSRASSQAPAQGHFRFYHRAWPGAAPAKPDPNHWRRPAATAPTSCQAGRVCCVAPSGRIRASTARIRCERRQVPPKLLFSLLPSGTIRRRLCAAAMVALWAGPRFATLLQAATLPLCPNLVISTG